MAYVPRDPQERPPVTCGVCMREYGSPASDPLCWVQHYGASLCKAAALPFRCYDCARAAIEPGAAPLFHE